jgi:archaellum component FlaF (FlaF/FlaG flagellin family)
MYPLNVECQQPKYVLPLEALSISMIEGAKKAKTVSWPGQKYFKHC